MNEPSLKNRLVTELVSRSNKFKIPNKLFEYNKTIHV